MTEVETGYFGAIELDDGDVVVADGGIHGVSGHTLRIGRDGRGRWSRRLDSLQPYGRPGSGRVKLDADERALVAAAADAAWGLDTRPAPMPEPPRWVWVVAVRRGDQTRAVEGSAMVVGDGAPAELAELLAWLRDRVDALAERRLTTWIRRRG